MRIAASLLLAAILTGCATARPGLPFEVNKALEKAQLTPANLGVMAFPLDQPQSGLRLNADIAMQPGSAMKLVTAAVALDRLGPNGRGSTEMLGDGPIENGVLMSPLYLRGGTDSDLDWGSLNALLRLLRDQGVREIRGGIVVDRSLFTPARLDAGQPPFDEQPEFPYNVIPDALMLNGNLLDFFLSSDDKSLSVHPAPAWPGIRIDTQDIALVDRACKDWEDIWKIPTVESDGGDAGPLIRLHGEFPRNCKVEQEFNLIDRQWLATHAVRAMWRELGGSIAEGGDREGVTPATAKVLATHRARPLAEVLRGVMKHSDNALARLTYLRIGVETGNADEPTLEASARAVRQWFAGAGIDTTGMVLDNGSGLSRSERITPAQLAGLLVASNKGRHGPELLATLPVAGVDGTLSRRFKGTDAQGMARMKTGTLNNAVALAGYVPDAGGRTWVVVGIVNAPEAGRGRAALDELVLWVTQQR